MKHMGHRPPRQLLQQVPHPRTVTNVISPSNISQSCFSSFWLLAVVPAALDCSFVGRAMYVTGVVCTDIASRLTCQTSGKNRTSATATLGLDYYPQTAVCDWELRVRTVPLPGSPTAGARMHICRIRSFVRLSRSIGSIED